MRKYLKIAFFLFFLVTVRLTVAQETIALNTYHSFETSFQPGYTYSWWFVDETGTQTFFNSNSIIGKSKVTTNYLPRQKMKTVVCLKLFLNLLLLKKRQAFKHYLPWPIFLSVLKTTRFPGILVQTTFMFSIAILILFTLFGEIIFPGLI